MTKTAMETHRNLYQRRNYVGSSIETLVKKIVIVEVLDEVRNHHNALDNVL
jgi:hypothetical protein